MWNTLIEEGALTDKFRARFGIDFTAPIVVHFILMSQELQDSLDYPSKLSRQPGHIERLKADGRLQAAAFLTRIGGGRPPQGPCGTVVEQVDATFLKRVFGSE